MPCWQLLGALLWVLAGSGTHFHLHAGIVDILPTIVPFNLLVCMLAIQITPGTVLVPPSSPVTSCTVSTTILVIIMVKGSKVHVIMVSHAIK